MATYFSYGTLPNRLQLSDPTVYYSNFVQSPVPLVIRLHKVTKRSYASKIPSSRLNTERRMFVSSSTSVSVSFDEVTLERLR